MNITLSNSESFPMKGRRQLTVDLWNDDKKIFSLLYDVPLHTARLESKGMRRVFMVYTEGKRFPKHVFKNEYGFDIGLIDPSEADLTYGCLRLYTKTFYYNLDFVSTGLLSVYEVTGMAPLLKLKLDSYSKGINDLPDDYFNFLLAGVCWYLQLPQKTDMLIPALQNGPMPSFAS